MLPFGSFITQIPLFLFTALYLLYLGFFTINKYKDKNTESKPAANEVHANIEKSTHPNLLRYFDYNPHQSEAAGNQTDISLFIKNATFNRIFAPEDNIVFSDHWLILFTRPPPEF